MTPNEEARQILDTIVAFMSRPDLEDDTLAMLIAKQSLWWILTALRGPDTYDDTLKELTTARIRGAIGLKLNSDMLFMSSKSTPEVLEEDTQSHFLYHYNEAVEALHVLFPERFPTPKVKEVK